MASITNKKLEDAQKKAVKDSHWPLATALNTLLSEPGNLDHQINVIGAMHELGFLRNRLKPYWEA